MSFMPSVRRRAFKVLLFGCFLLFLAGCSGGKAAPVPPPLVVEVAAVVQQDTPIYSEWVATLDGYVNAEIQPRVSGYIIKQNYKEGSVVRKDEVLFEIDPRPFKAALDQAKAQLAQAEAQLGKASLDVERDTPLAQARKANWIRRSRRSSVRRLWFWRRKRTSSRLNSTWSSQKSRPWSVGSPASPRSKSGTSLDPAQCSPPCLKWTRLKPISP